jgi:hypothetical protein
MEPIFTAQLWKIFIVIYEEGPPIIIVVLAWLYFQVEQSLLPHQLVVGQCTNVEHTQFLSLFFSLTFMEIRVCPSQRIMVFFVLCERRAPCYRTPPIRFWSGPAGLQWCAIYLDFFFCFSWSHWRRRKWRTLHRFIRWIAFPPFYSFWSIYSQELHRGTALPFNGHKVIYALNQNSEYSQHHAGNPTEFLRELPIQYSHPVWVEVCRPPMRSILCQQRWEVRWL